jgi:hypothetical protein
LNTFLKYKKLLRFFILIKLNILKVLIQIIFESMNNFARNLFRAATHTKAIQNITKNNYASLIASPRKADSLTFNFM